MTGEVIFITGGARSGKSGCAERMAREFGDAVLYIATARAFDEEMRARIQNHRARRPAAWRTFEGVDGLAEAITGFEGCVLLDCVTLFLTNRMLDSGYDFEHPVPAEVERVEQAARAEMDQLIERVRAQGNTLILVSNEVGMGIVPEYPFSRVFRDAAGRLNAHLAARADRAIFMVSGLEMRLK